MKSTSHSLLLQLLVWLPQPVRCPVCLAFSCCRTGLPEGDLEVGGHPAHLPRAGVGLLSLRSRGESTHPQPRSPGKGSRESGVLGLPTGGGPSSRGTRYQHLPCASGRIESGKASNLPSPSVSLSLSEGHQPVPPSHPPSPATGDPSQPLHPSQVSCRALRLTRWASCGGLEWGTARPLRSAPDTHLTKAALQRLAGS